MQDLYVSEDDIAVIGMSGRFPGANNLEEYWRILRDGIECITPVSEEQMRDALLKSLGYVPENTVKQLLKDPRYVPMASVLDDIDLFDADFFGYTTTEAELLDPQQRLFLECAWEVMEDAGYDPHNYRGLIGVYGGTEESFYHHNLQAPLLPTQRDFLTLLGNEGSYLTTRVSYKLNCKGPSFNIQSACSTALVAIHVACQSLKSGECDMALAGGVVAYPTQHIGYIHQEGSLTSPDGHCRPFDAQAQGTVMAHGGVGGVLLKPLRDALNDGDAIYAVIKGSAVSNDGLHKVGYAAPSINGQMQAVTEAIAVSDTGPDTIQYVEAYGSATPLGDSAEIAALTQAFRTKTKRRQFCALGSVKSNLGHLGAASGAAAFIKTVLALYNKQIPPSLHCEHPHPLIDFDNSPFYLNTRLTEWKQQGQAPRLAGVHSIGIGGTNAHLILQEAPDVSITSTESRPVQLLTLSARTTSALRQMARNLSRHLKQHPDQNLADIAYTLQVGRHAFDVRQMVVCRDHAEAIQALEVLDADGSLSSLEGIASCSVAFVFLDKGECFANRGYDLYQHETVFREHVHQCTEILKAQLKADLRDYIYAQDKQQIDNGIVSVFVYEGLVSFITSYALAKLWISWGVRPGVVLGQGVGEYVAGCLAGIFTLEEVLSLLLLWDDSKKRDQLLKTIVFKVPTIPFISNGMGDMIQGMDASNVQYWQRQNTSVGLDKGIQNVLNNPEMLLLAIGTGDFQRDTTQRVIFSSHSSGVDFTTLLTALGVLWLSGIQVDWVHFYAREQRRRVHLPTYPFERRRYWLYPVTQYSQENTVSVQPVADTSLRPDTYKHSKTLLSELSLRDHLNARKYERISKPRPALKVPYTAPRNEIEHVLIAILQDLFGIEQIGIYDDIYELGVHSLLAIKFAARVKQLLDLDLPVAQILQIRTAAHLAEHLEEILIAKIEALSDEEVQELTQKFSHLS